VTLDDAPVGGDPLSGLDQDAIAPRELRDGDVLGGAVVAEAMGLGRQQLDQLFERARRTITERISIQWPSSMTSIRVASSQKKGMPSKPKATAMEKP
jgi:hypothetical protein